MNPIHFGFTRSKVKVTLTLNVKMVSADYLENHLSQRFHISPVDWSWLGDDPFFILGSLGQRFRSQETLNVKMVSADYIENRLSLSFHMSHVGHVKYLWPLLILWSVGQRSRTQWPCMRKWFTHIFLKFINQSKQC